MKKLEKVNLNQNSIEIKINKRENEITNLLLDHYNWKKNFVLKESAAG